jgi:hypothetical protein
MTRLLPKSVKDLISSQVRQAVDNARQEFPNIKKEDSVTGVLSGALSKEVRGEVGGYKWETSRHILSSQSKSGHQEEPELGADMIYEVRIEDPNGEIRTKSVLIQAKSSGDTDNKRLRGQCEKMGEVPGRHLVVEYDKEKFTAFPADVVLEKKGSLAKAEEEASDLSEAIGKDFLNCYQGQRGLTYDATNRVLLLKGPLPVGFLGLLASNHVVTSIIAEASSIRLPAPKVMR